MFNLENGLFAGLKKLIGKIKKKMLNQVWMIMMGVNQKKFLKPYNF